MAANDRPPLKLTNLEGVRVFAAGRARGEDWTEADIDAIVRNWRAYRDLLKPTAVIGHEEAQPLTDGMSASSTQNTGEPAFGVVSDARKEYQVVRGQKVPTLVADFADVPHWFANLIRGKAYRSVSAELYDKPPEGFDRASGPMLRRVAFLGGELPQIKTLGDLPLPEYAQYSERSAVQSIAELRRVERRGGMVLTFCEVMPMAGRAKRNAKKLTDLTAKSRATLEKFADGDAAPDDTGPATPSRDEMLALLLDAGYDSAVLDTASDQLLAEMVRVWQAQSTGNAPDPTPEPTQMSATAPSTPAPAIAPPPSAHPQQVTYKYGERDGLTLDQYLDLRDADRNARLHKTIDDYEQSKKREALFAFAEAEVKAGRLLPSEAWVRDPKTGERRPGPALRLALGLDNGVKKFGETGELTALDEWKQSISARPILVAFAERMHNPQPGSADAEKAKVVRFSEAHVASLKGAGKTPTEFVRGFEDAQKKKPELTALEYGIPAEFCA